MHPTVHRTVTSDIDSVDCFQQVSVHSGFIYDFLQVLLLQAINSQNIPARPSKTAMSCTFNSETDI